MPTTNINFTPVSERLQQSDFGQLTVCTPYGLAILEIQGDLNLPAPPQEPQGSQFVKIDNIYDAVKCGNLEFSDDPASVVLYIANSQRLMGKIVKLDPPLGILKVSTGEQTMDMVDIVTHKMVFNERPLPIM